MFPTRIRATYSTASTMSNTYRYIGPPFHAGPIVIYSTTGPPFHAGPIVIYSTTGPSFHAGPIVIYSTTMYVNKHEFSF